MAFAIGSVEPFCTCMAHKEEDAASRVFGQLRWVASMPISLTVPVGYIQRHIWRLKGEPGLGRGPGRDFLRSRKGRGFGPIWRAFRGL